MSLNVRKETILEVRQLVGTMVDKVNREFFRKSLLDSLQTGSGDVLVDLRGVNNMSSAGFQSLLEAQRVAKKSNRTVKLAHLAPRIKEKLEISGFGDVLPVAEDESVT